MEVSSEQNSTAARPVPGRDPRRLARAAGWGVLATGALGLLGWVLDIPTLRSLRPALPPMMPETAIAFVLAGGALRLLAVEVPGRAARFAGLAAGWLIVLIGALAVGEHAFGWQAGLNQVFLRDGHLTTAAPGAGRNSLLSGINLLVFGPALLLLDWRNHSQRWLADLLAVIPVQVALLALVGYACNVPAFYGWRTLWPDAAMSLPAALAWAVLGTGLLCARPDQGLMRIIAGSSAGGLVARRLLLAPVIIPLVTGLVGMQFRRAGLYNAEVAGWFFSFLNIFIFTLVIWWISVLLHRADEVRRHAEAEVTRARAELESRVAERTAELAHANQQLGVGEQRYRNLVEVSPDAIFLIQQNRIVFINSAGLKLLRAARPEDVLGRPPLGFFHPDIHAFVLTRERELLARPCSVPLAEEKLLAVDGTAIPVEAAAASFYSGGELVIQVVCHDLTGRRQAEAALQEERQRLAGLIDSAMDAVVTVDESQRITLFNPAAEQMFGYPAAQMLGEPLDRLLPERAVAAHRGHVREFGRTGVSSRRMGALNAVTGRRADGEEFSLEAAISQVEVGGRKYFTAILRDITGRQRAEAALRESEERLRLATEAAQLGTWTRDFKTGRLHWSASQERLMGFKPGTFPGTYEAFLELLHPESHDVLAAAQTLAQAAGGRYQAELRFRLRDGSERWGLVRGQIVAGKDGQPERMVGVELDITERKAAEARMAWLATFPEQNPNPVIELELARGVIHYANPASRKAFPDLASLGLRHPLFTGLGDAAGDLLAGRREVLRREILIGDTCYAQTINCVGDARRIRIYNSDITERRRAEQLLARERTVLRTLIDALPDNIYTKDLEGRFLLGNRAHQQFIGAATEAEMVGRTDFDLHPAHLAEQYRADDLRVLLQGETVFNREELGRDAEGREQWYLTIKAPLRDAAGRITGLVGISRNIQEIRETRQALQEGELRLHTIVESLAEGVAVSDLEGRLLHFNRAALAMHGFATLEECRRHLHEFSGLFELSALDGTALPVGEWPLARILRGEVLRDLEVRVRQVATGWQRVFAYGGSLVQDASGQSLMAVVTINDVTERRQAEEEIHRLNADLERRVAERTAELRAKNRELETFSYSVSHDLKAPLRGLDGYSRLLLEDYHDRLDEEGRRFLRNIRGAATQMQQLIDDLLAYSRLERRTLAASPVEPQTVVQAVLNERRHDLEGVQLTVALAPGRVRADPEGLALALRNLLDNALKFSRQRQPPVVEISSRVADGRCVFSVRDNGTGFDMKYHDRIFQIFQRLHRAEEYSGTGIGLAIVHKAAERMGGRVWAESVPDQGSIFYLDLPATESDASLQQGSPSPT